MNSHSLGCSQCMTFHFFAGRTTCYLKWLPVGHTLTQLSTTSCPCRSSISNSFRSWSTSLAVCARHSKTKDCVRANCTACRARDLWQLKLAMSLASTMPSFVSHVAVSCIYDCFTIAQNKDYETVFVALLRHFGVITIAVYRHQSVKRSPLPYTITCPPPSLVASQTFNHPSFSIFYMLVELSRTIFLHRCWVLTTN